MPTIGTIRPNAPIVWPFSRATNFNMARHHILPYTTLRDLWNNLVQHFSTTQLPEARVAIRQFLALCSSSRTIKIDVLLDKLRADQLTVADVNELQETAVWAAWNIVDGPKNRSDDPHDSYIDRFTFGVTMEEYQRLPVIEHLYLCFQQFNTAGAEQPALLQSLAAELNLARAKIGFVALPTPFRPEMWEKELDGRWHKRRSGDQFLKMSAR